LRLYQFPPRKKNINMSAFLATHPTKRAGNDRVKLHAAAKQLKA
jgi:hypothetical protein